MPLLDVQNLRVHFHTRHGLVRAVNGVSFAVERGQAVGLVGESGSGKSVTSHALLGLLPMPPARVEEGSAIFDRDSRNMDLLGCDPETLRHIRGRHIAMVFQDPMTALTPYLTIGAQVMEPLLVHEPAMCKDRAQARLRVTEMLTAVGIPRAMDLLDAYPHEFSGGMRQRVLIAMALITRPTLLIADEPTTALDVTVQAQILALINQMRHALGMALILVTHNLGVVAGCCDRVLVMYAGHIMESAPVESLFRAPRHPYTRGLMASLPSLQGTNGPLNTIPGMPPNLAIETTGCPFAPRCSQAHPKCHSADMVLREIAPGHSTACVCEQEGKWK